MSSRRLPVVYSENSREKLGIIDLNGHPIRPGYRGDIHREGLLHWHGAIVITNRPSETEPLSLVLGQVTEKRSGNPGLWAIPTCHVRWGENPQEAIYREFIEEAYRCLIEKDPEALEILHGLLRGDTIIRLSDGFSVDRESLPTIDVYHVGTTIPYTAHYVRADGSIRTEGVGLFVARCDLRGGVFSKRWIDDKEFTDMRAMTREDLEAALAEDIARMTMGERQQYAPLLHDLITQPEPTSRARLNYTAKLFGDPKEEKLEKLVHPASS